MKRSTDIVVKAERGRLPTVMRYIRNGVDVDTRDSEGCTALIAAVANGHTAVVRALLEAGANPNLATGEGMTAIMCATSAEVVNLLVTAGADVNAGAYAVSNALAGAAVWGRVEVIAALIRAGANVNAADQAGLTALHRAAWKGQIAAIEALLRAGANVEAKDWRGKTPYDWACNDATARVLLSTRPDAAQEHPSGGGG